MLPELHQLIDLHELDKKNYELSQNLDTLPQELEDMGQEMAALETKRSSHAQELEELKKQLREMEAEVSDLEEGIKTSRQRLMDIGKELELKAMLKEIAFREDQRDQKETLVLELFDQVEAKNQAIAEQDQTLQQLKTAYDRRAAEVAAQVNELETQRAALVSQRESLREGLPAQLLKRYEFILRRRNGNAISEVRAGVCLGCHLNILPQQYIDLQKGEEIIQCPHCQRILYWLGEEEEEEKAEPPTRKAKAS
ncbi:MAG: C4-type zinc ribbon domain-containing protein [Desulfobaccales bacterium]